MNAQRSSDAEHVQHSMAQIRGNDADQANTPDWLQHAVLWGKDSGSA
jgi:hypothetical protein